jgi:parallel beta-helix repeat protein
MVNRLKNALWLIVGAVVAVWAVTSLVGVVQGGPMDPPGPPGETTIPLNDIRGSTPLYPEDMPYNLTHSGSYYLTGDMHVLDPGTDGITISADNVTLDLNGFALIGPGKGVGTDDGVHIECVVGYCDGISLYNGSVREWGGNGVYGAEVSSSLFQDLRLTANGGVGLAAGDSNIVVRCAAYSNGGTGIASRYDNVVADSSAYANEGNGISVSDGSTVSNCTATSNFGDGISALDGGTVRDCTATFNSGDGIEVGNHTLVVANNADSSGFSGDGAGIHVTGANNRIEGNNVTNNDIGIDVDSGGNLIIKNSWRGNTVGYSFALNNTYGEIIVGAQEPIPDGASPWANFGY